MFDALQRIEDLEAELAEAQQVICRLNGEAEQTRIRAIATVLERDHYKSRAAGEPSDEPSQLIDALQDAVHQSKEFAEGLLHECEAMRFSLMEARVQLCQWRTCCTMFFHVAGKPEAQSWEQYERAAKMYQSLNDQYGTYHPCDDCDD